jgi:MYXO-CTERM domain-containing protein
VTWCFVFKDFSATPFCSALAQLVPNPPPSPVIIRSAPPVQASLGPTSVTAPPERVTLEPAPSPLESVKPRTARSRRKMWMAVGFSALAAFGIGVGMHPHAKEKPQIVSGRAGPKLTPTGVAERWWQGDLTITVDESVATVWPDANAGLETAFDTWREANGKLPNVTFDARPAAPLLLEPDGENRIYYGPITVPGHEKDLAITLQYADQSSGEIVEADVIVNSHHPFAVLVDDDDAATGTVTDCKEKYDVTSVVTHEIGHFWGLGEDMVDTNATMFFSTPPCNVRKRQLKTDDVKAVSALYAVAAPSGDSATKAMHCALTSVGGAGDPGAAGAAMVGMVLVLGATARRRRRTA